LVIVFLATPILAALWFGLTAGGGDVWQHILHNRLLPYTLTTMAVLILAGAMMLAIAIPAAWLVSLYDFPGRRFFEWALILPLAMPGYVMAYAWADLAGVAGPLQSGLRDVTGWRARDYWFPDLFSTPGLAFVLASTLFPYVYITARAAMVTQSLATIEAARSLGASGWHLFRRVAFPVALPAVIAGLSLALMEAAADYGAADFLGVQTLGVGIIRAWSSFGEPATAARLALALVGIAFLFIIVARLAQGRGGQQQTSSRWLSPSRAKLSRGRAAAAFGFCGLVLLVAFVAPVGRLIWLAFENGIGRAPLGKLLASTLILAATGTVVAFVCALVLTNLAQRFTLLGRLGKLATTAGYAAPGVVLGLGALFLLQASNGALTGAAALGFLIWIYASRFTAAAADPLKAAALRAPRTLDMAAQGLGRRGLARFWSVDLPILWPGAVAGGLILFVEVIKELPATLMLRPFGWDTLAVKAHAYASDERLAEATVPSLLIVLAGLVPVLLLSWRLSKAGRTV
jgi:iron(III) transport system permease protein